MPRGWVVAVLLGLMAVSVFVGTRPMPPAETLQALTRFDPMRGHHLLVWQLRLPRVLLGAVVGAAMGLAAVLMQALTRNPLADPGILGINAGAALAVVAVLALGCISVGVHDAAALAGVRRAVSGRLNPLNVAATRERNARASRADDEGGPWPGSRGHRECAPHTRLIRVDHVLCH